MPLNFDPVAEARRNWAKHWGDEPVPSMSAVTSIMRVQQILLARLNEDAEAVRPDVPALRGADAPLLLARGALPLGKMGDRLQVHRTSVTNIIDGLERSASSPASATSATAAPCSPRSPAEGRETAEQATPVLNGDRFGTAPLAVEELDAITKIFERMRADADGFPAP